MSETEPKSNPTFKDIENILKKIPEQEGFANNYYTFLHVGAQILLMTLHNKKTKDDVKSITLPDGSPAFTDENDINKLNELLESHGDKIKDILQSVMTPAKANGGEQTGGGPLGASPGAIDKLIEVAKSVYIPPEEMSIDRQYTKMLNYFDDLDEQNRTLARELGLVALVSHQKVDPFFIIPTPTPIRVQFPVRLILPIINVLLEVTRIFFAIVPFGTIPMQFFTIVQTLFDIARGEWKYGVFTFMGFFNGGLLIFGVFLKLLRDVWLLIEPRIARRLRLEIFIASKSIFLGFILRLTTAFLPDTFRATLEAALTPLNVIVNQVNQKLETIQETLNQGTEKMGVKVTLPHVPQDAIPSLDNIQALQMAISQPEIYCSDEFRPILEPIKSIPPLRLILELMGVAIDEDIRAVQCKGIETSSISSAFIDALMPKVEVIPGGPIALAKAAEMKGLSEAGVSSIVDKAKSEFVPPAPEEAKEEEVPAVVEEQVEVKKEEEPAGEEAKEEEVKKEEEPVEEEEEESSKIEKPEGEEPATDTLKKSGIELPGKNTLNLLSNPEEAIKSKAVKMLNDRAKKLIEGQSKKKK